MSDDLVAKWNISLTDGKYKIEFEHGTTSGRRVIRVNDKVCLSFFISMSNFKINVFKFHF